MKIARYYQKAAADKLYEAITNDASCHPIAAIPTGSGKTMVINEFVDNYLTHNYNGNILVLSHVKEILEQNYNSLVDHFEGFDIGLYSTGLESKTLHKITVAGIQSVFRQPQKFKGFNVIIIDECHLINTKQTGMYRGFLNELDANYVGLTATPFRTGHGYIHVGDDALFNALVFNMCDVEGFKELINGGFLCPLISKGTNMKMETENLGTRMNDYIPKEMSERFDRESITNKAVDEIIEFGQSYKKWLVFAIDIEHAEHIAQAMRARGIATACVHSKMEKDRTIEINRFKSEAPNSYRCLVNVDILTTGFDAPNIDLIAMMRPTQSPILHVQTLGRGMRVSPGKDHCLVLDFAGNVSRLGPINDITVKQKGNGKGGPMVKECPECQGHLHLAVMLCPFCGYKFPVTEKLQETADTSEIIKLDPSPVITQPEWLNVSQVFYSLHIKRGSPEMMKVSYLCGMKTFSEFICYEHDGYAGHKAWNWVQFRLISGGMPLNTRDLIEFARKKLLREPNKVLVNVSARFPVIENVKFVNS